MKEKTKTAVIMIGGAMRSSHGAGFLYAMATKLHITHPDIMIGSSGDAGNMLYYVAGQYESGRRIWIDLLSTKKFISRRRFWRMMDVDYLVDTVLKKLEPLDVERIEQSTIRWFIPISDYDSGRVRYVSAQDHLDVFELLRAAKAAPLFYGKKIPLARRRYIDGEYGPTEEDHVRFAIAQGAKKIVVVRHARPWSALARLQTRLYMLFASKNINKAIRRDMAMDSPYVDIPGAQILLVRPQWLPLKSVADNDRDHMRANFERGVEDALAFKKQLLELFAPEPPVLYSADELGGAQKSTT